MTKTASADYIAKEVASERQPAELYHFWIEDGTHWRYTSGDVAVVYDTHTWVPATIEREAVQWNAEMEVGQLTVMAPSLSVPAIQFIAVNPVESMWIEVLKIFRDQSPVEVLVVFVGQVHDVSFRGIEASVACMDLAYFFRKTVPRYRYQPSCNNQLYDDFCGIDRDDFDHAVTLTSVGTDGLTLEGAAFGDQADGYFQFGDLVWQGHRRMIVEHSGTAVKMQYAVPGLAAGHSVTAYAGCDWKYDTCNSRFSNTNNFFGMRYIPYRNPTLFLR